MEKNVPNHQPDYVMLHVNYVVLECFECVFSPRMCVISVRVNSHKPENYESGPTGGKETGAMCQTKATKRVQLYTWFHFWSPFACSMIQIWRFPKTGVPLNHQF